MPVNDELRSCCLRDDLREKERWDRWWVLISALESQQCTHLYKEDLGVTWDLEDAEVDD